MLDKRSLLIQTATELFAAGGYTAVGIDKIIAQAGVAKMTLYKHFPSKTDLIVAVLKQRDQQFRDSLMAFVEQSTATEAKLQAIFLWHEQWFQQADFNGCLFINAAAEFHDHQDAIHQCAAEHKQHIVAYLTTLLTATYPLEQAPTLAAQLALLLDGAIVTAQVMNNPNAARQAWDIAKPLLSKASEQKVS